MYLQITFQQAPLPSPLFPDSPTLSDRLDVASCDGDRPSYEVILLMLQLYI